MIKDNKHRFVILIDKESYEKFRKLAEEQSLISERLLLRIILKTTRKIIFVLQYL